MDAQLEIVCKQSPSTRPRQWSGISIQNIITKLRESYTHKHTEDDWEIPFDRIRMTNDFQRCGSQGDVFYGKLSNNPVAVKRVQDVNLTNVRHLRELNHKNVVKFRGVSQNSNHFYIIMEWCPYGTLHDHIHKGRQLSSTILSNFVQQIANGMKYLHSKNIIHRDLKPSNILLTHHDVLKISDFGTHKALNDDLPVKSNSYAGTHAYMAPEVIRSEEYSFSVDVWSYGVVAWEIFVGDEPYKNLDGSAVVWAVGNNLFRLPIPSSFPEGFRRIINGCWKADKKERLTFQQICMILKGAIHEVDNISKEGWLALQAEWKRETREELNRQFNNDPIEDKLRRQKKQILDEEQERAQKIRNKNNHTYLKLQECCMHLQREIEVVVKREESVAKREKEVEKREKDLAMIFDELSRRGIKLECLQNEEENNNFNKTNL